MVATGKSILYASNYSPVTEIPGIANSFQGPCSADSKLIFPTSKPSETSQFWYRAMPQCIICLRWFPTHNGLVHHRANQSRCKEQWTERVLRRVQQTEIFDPDDPEAVPRDDEPQGGYNPLSEAEMEELAAGYDPPHITMSAAQATGPTDPELPQVPVPPLIRRVVPHTNPSKIYGSGETVFEKRRQEEKERGMNPYREFESAEIFEVAEWMLDSELSQRAETRLLKTRMVQSNSLLNVPMDRNVN